MTLVKLKQSFYNLNDGEIANIDNTNWDLAFSSSGYGSAIRINAQAGVELFVYPNGDIDFVSSSEETPIFCAVMELISYCFIKNLRNFYYKKKKKKIKKLFLY